MYMTLPMPFSSDRWKQAQEGDDRGRMLWDLEHRVGLVGRTRAEAIALLGQPLRVNETGSITYYLCDGFIDPLLLNVELSHGRVTGTSISQS